MPANHARHWFSVAIQASSKDSEGNSHLSLEVCFVISPSSLLGFIPGPVVFGSLIDSTCLVWQTSCGERGACALYDNHDFRYKLHAATAVFKCVAVFFYFVMFVILWKRRYYYEEEVVVFESKTRESVTIYNIDAT